MIPSEPFVQEHPIRLQKFLSRCGIGSRRYCETLIEEGRVTVNGVIIQVQGTRIQPGKDQVCVDGKSVQMSGTGKMVVVLNKPVGFVTTRNDPLGDKTVYDLLPEEFRFEVFPVGRLDKDSSGLLLLTNDGELAFKLMHPGFGVEKTYELVLRGIFPEQQVRRLEQGVKIPGGMSAPAKVTNIRYTEKNTLLSLTLHEGKKRQIRRMCYTLWFPLESLKRSRQGPITLGNLQEGQWRMLTSQEIQALENSLPQAQ